MENRPRAKLDTQCKEMICLEDDEVRGRSGRRTLAKLFQDDVGDENAIPGPSGCLTLAKYLENIVVEGRQSPHLHNSPSSLPPTSQGPLLPPSPFPWTPRPPLPPLYGQFLTDLTKDSAQSSLQLDSDDDLFDLPNRHFQ